MKNLHFANFFIASIAIENSVIYNLFIIEMIMSCIIYNIETHYEI